uniref:BZIP domain-containing protein n=1 Tax=Heligmosomoides polygyrus TaxID=6339 RepID=A0A183GJ47_HELPZ
LPPSTEIVDTSPSSSQAPVGAFHEILSTQPAKQPWTPSTATTPSVPSTTAPLSSSTAHTATATTPAHTATATTPKPLSVDHSTNGLTSSTVERTTAEPRPGMNDGSVQHERKSFPISSERDDGGEEEEVEMEYDAQEILSEFSKMPPPPSTAPPTTTTTAAKTFSPSAIRPTVSNHPGRRPAVNLMPTSFILEQKPSFTGNVSVMQTLPPIPPKQMTEAPVYEKESKKGKQSRLRRLRILNRRARVKPISMMTPRTAAVNDEMRRLSKNKGRMELENQMTELQQLIIQKKKKLAQVMKTSTPPALLENVEGDTAKALSWMFANVAKMMNENPNQAVIDVAPVQRVDDDTRQNLSRLPSGVEVISEQESFVLKDDASSDPVIKVDKQTADGRDRPQGDNGALLGST